MNPTRTISGSIPSSRARPAETPPTYPRAGSRRSVRRGGGGVADAVDIDSMVSVAAAQAARQQDRPDRRAGDRGDRAEPQLDRALRVQHEQTAEDQQGQA